MTWGWIPFTVATTNTNLYYFTKFSMALHQITSQNLYLPLYKILQTIIYVILTIFKIIEPTLTSFITHFVPSSICAWNDLPNDIQNAPSIVSFKYKLNRNLKAPHKYYNAGSRKAQILQARLRLECSSLNSDLYRKHIVPSPSFQCGGFESAAHFLLTCPIFMNARQSYLPGNLGNFTLKELLFGKQNATEQDNQSLFLQVQDFIVKSGRFI